MRRSLGCVCIKTQTNAPAAAPSYHCIDAKPLRGKAERNRAYRFCNTLIKALNIKALYDC